MSRKAILDVVFVVKLRDGKRRCLTLNLDSEDDLRSLFATALLFE